MNKNKESNIENEEFDLFRWDSEISKREIPWNLETLKTWITEFKKRIMKKDVS